ncbi:hypothetical protein [Paenibacillus sp. N3.4]|uniref:hypothetical protein n=1 Tax=Paenibacillus sp. N3.4 TaxID=2603222 RepID=UPI0011DA47DE|nr:hypothetical protein [Paenibacillus sp. N3.4]TXK84436.1 hypothetical protein FU659_08390 [Paenibacillus sp. N3.4]
MKVEGEDIVKRYVIFAFVIMFFTFVLDDLYNMPSPPRQESEFSEEDVLQKTVKELGLPNLPNNTNTTRNVKFCGKEPYSVAFEIKVQKADSGNYVVVVSDTWTNDADRQEKLKRIRIYYVSQESFKQLYLDGSLTAAIGECSDDEYGLKSFRPVTSGVFIPKEEVDQMMEHSGGTEATLAFVRAWAAKSREDFMKWSEPSSGMTSMADTLLDDRFSYAFTGMHGPILQDDQGKLFCLGVKYKVSDSIEKEERHLESAICSRPTSEGKWNVYMID